MNSRRGRWPSRAEREGISYSLPDNVQSQVFKEKFYSMQRDSTELLEVLHLAEESYNYLPKNVLGWIAQELKIPPSQVYTTSTFYTMFSTEPTAKFVINACDCLSCYLRGSEAVFYEILVAARIPEGKPISSDGLFSIQKVSCLGLCDQAPVISINQERYVSLTPQKVRQIISELRSEIELGVKI